MADEKDVRDLKNRVEELRRQEAEKAKPYRDDLDEALSETFPASDPPARVSKGTPSGKPQEESPNRK